MTTLLRSHMPVLRYLSVQGLVDGYLAIWGDPTRTDSYNTYFDRSRPPNLGLMHDAQGDLIPIRLMYEHGFDGEIRRDIVGQIVRIWQDETGIRFQARLDKSKPYTVRLVEELQAGLLGISSASADHLADFAHDGRFEDWLLSEVSLTKQPAEPQMPAATIRSELPAGENAQPGGDLSDRGADVGAAVVSFARKQPEKRTMLTLEELGLQPSATIEEVITALVEKLGQEAAMAFLNSQMGGDSTPAPDANTSPEGMSAPDAQPPAGRSDVMALVRQLLPKTPATPAPATPAPNGDLAAIRAELAAIRAERMTAPVDGPTPVRTRTPQISVGEERRYQPLSYLDMAFGHMLLRSQRLVPSENYVRHLAGKAVAALEKSDRTMSDYAVRSLLPQTVRANEVAISTAAGGGDEWVSIAWSSAIWETARSNLIYQQLVSKGMHVEEIPQGAESIYILTEGADPTVYTIAQDADLAASGRPDVNVAATRIGTGRVLLTPGELGMAVVYSDVFEEDSLINVLGQYNKQMQRKAEETVEQLFINGDVVTTASTNINLIDGTPGTGLSTPYYIASDGALKYALVTGSSTSRDGGALDENDYRLTLGLMPAAIRTRISNLAFIIDPDTASASLDIPAIKTDDVKRTNATITSGIMNNIWGVDVFESGLMLLANSAGKIPTAGGTLGRILAVYAPYWAVGWKRHITIKTQEDILSGDTIIVAKMRVGFKPRGAGASTVSYNLTV